MVVVVVVDFFLSFGLGGRCSSITIVRGSAQRHSTAQHGRRRGKRQAQRQRAARQAAGRQGGTATASFGGMRGALRAPLPPPTGGLHAAPKPYDQHRTARSTGARSEAEERGALDEDGQHQRRHLSRSSRPKVPGRRRPRRESSPSPCSGRGECAGAPAPPRLLGLPAQGFRADRPQTAAVYSPPKGWHRLGPEGCRRIWLLVVTMEEPHGDSPKFQHHCVNTTSCTCPRHKAIPDL